MTTIDCWRLKWFHWYDTIIRIVLTNGVYDMFRRALGRQLFWHDTAAPVNGSSIEIVTKGEYCMHQVVFGDILFLMTLSNLNSHGKCLPKTLLMIWLNFAVLYIYTSIYLYVRATIQCWTVIKYMVYILIFVFISLKFEFLPEIAEN